MPKGWFLVTGRADIHYFLGQPPVPLCARPSARTRGRIVLGPEQDAGRNPSAPPMCPTCRRILVADLTGENPTVIRAADTT